MPLVSIVIPSYNYGRFLTKTLGSVLGQTGFSDFEVLVVDDASRDESAAILRACDDQRLRPIFHATNLGHLRALNDGFSAAKGKYLLCLGADDLLAPAFLAKTVPILEKHPEVGLVHTNCAIVDEQGKIAETKLGSIPYSGDRLGDELPEILIRNFIPPVCALFRHEHLALLGGGYPPEIPFGEDWHLWLLIAKRHPFYFIDETLAYYRVHSGQIHGTLLRTRAAEQSQCLILNQFFAAELPSRVAHLKGQAYARIYLDCAEGHYAAGSPKDTLRCLRLAIENQPGLIGDVNVWKRYVLASMPPTVVRRLKSALGRG